MLAFTLSLSAWGQEVELLPPKKEYDEVFMSAAVMPSFPGGNDALMKLIQDNIEYPETAFKKVIDGKAIVQFVVEKDGQIGEVKVAASSGYFVLDNEAMRVCRSLPPFNPGRNANGEPVCVWYTVPVYFSLSRVKEEQTIDTLYRDALLDDVIAQYKLGERYYYGRGVQQDYAQAYYWLQKAEQQGDYEALDLLLVISVLNKDYIQASDYLKKLHSIDNNNSNISDYLYKLALKEDEKALSDDKKIELLTDAARMGNIKAILDMMLYYSCLTDDNNHYDEGKATEFYKQYLKITNEPFDNVTIVDLFYQIGIRKDKELVNETKNSIFLEKYMNVSELESIIYLEKAADMGHTEAQVMMGDYYSGVSEYSPYNISSDDLYKAAFYYGEAAKNGNAKAQFLLGNLYANGYGVKQDPLKSVELIEKAAQQGLSDAQYKLGKFYAQGFGVEPNMKKAIEWYSKAETKGHADAAKALREINENATQALLDFYEVGAGKKHIKEYRNAAENNNVKAQRIMGDCYYYGDGVKQDFNQAIAYYKRGVEICKSTLYNYDDTYSLLICNLAGTYAHIKEFDNAMSSYDRNIYDEGDLLYTVASTIYPDKKYLDFLHDAATLGDKRALSDLACIYALGKDVKRDDKKAIELYRQYSSSPFQDVTQNQEVTIADVYYLISWPINGMIANQRDGDQEQWLIKAAELGSIKAQEEMAKQYEKKEDYSNALVWLFKLAEQGDEWALFTAGDYYEEGKGVAKNHKTAIEYYKKAADLGSPYAQYIIGECYLKGDILPKDPQKAAEMFEKAIINCNDYDVQFKANYYLALCYYEGLGVEQNYKEAAQFFNSALYSISSINAKVIFQEEVDIENAALQGDSEAQYDLGNSYRIENDYEQALYWYNKAGEQGHVEAQYALANLYRNGEDYGKAKDDVKAFNWYKKAADQGLADAQYKVGEYYSTGKAGVTDPNLAKEYYYKAATSLKAKAEELLEKNKY